MTRDLSNPLGLMLLAAFPTLCGEAPPIVCPGCGVKNWDAHAAKIHARWCETLPGAAPRDERKGTP